MRMEEPADMNGRYELSSIDTRKNVVNFHFRPADNWSAVETRSISFESLKAMKPYLSEKEWQDLASSLYTEAGFDVDNPSGARRRRAEVHEAHEDPTFGELVSGNRLNGVAKFRKANADGTVTQVELTGEMVIGIANSLSRAGAMNKDTARAMHDFAKRNGGFTETKPKIFTEDDAMALLLRAVKNNPDVLKAAGELLTKVTNEVSKIIRDSDPG